MNNPELSSLLNPRILRDYNWPISTQGASSATGDDYDIWSTIYKPAIDLLAGKLVVRPILIDFFTLSQRNSFGNYARFTNRNGRYFSNPYLSSSLKEAGGSVVSTSGDADAVSKFGDYIIDHFSGVAYNRTSQTAATWANALTAANSLSQLDHDDWHVLSYAEFNSITTRINATSSVNNQPLGWFPFFRTSATNYWTSATDYNASTFAYIINATQGALTINAKSGSLAYFVARKHF